MPKFKHFEQINIFRALTKYNLNVIIHLKLKKIHIVGNYSIKCVVSNSTVKCTADNFALKLYCY